MDCIHFLPKILSFPLHELSRLDAYAIQHWTPPRAHVAQSLLRIIRLIAYNPSTAQPDLVRPRSFF